MIKTTVIGSFPKPLYLKIPDWFGSGHNRTTINYDIKKYTEYTHNKNEESLYNILVAGLLQITELIFTLLLIINSSAFLLEQ